MKNLFLLICLALILSSCTGPTGVNPMTVEEPPPLPEREAIFTPSHEERSTALLNFASEPFPLKRGYVRLVGVVNGSEGKIALLEIGGKGLACKIGEEVEEYKVSSINEREVVLCLGK